jgi:hypothetical protein
MPPALFSQYFGSFEMKLRFAGRQHRSGEKPWPTARIFIHCDAAGPQHASSQRNSRNIAKTSAAASQWIKIGLVPKTK